MDEQQAKQIPPLALAYIGDAVYDQYVRTTLIEEHPGANSRELHKLATRIVCAGAQAKTLRAILDELNDEEQEIYRRGRNANSPSVPKNANVVEYRTATGFEAVLGYRHMAGDYGRLNEILQLARQKGWKENADGKDKP